MNTSLYKNQISCVVFFIALFLVMFFARGGEFFLEPRIWAEGGKVYLSSALSDGWRSFFQPHLGYFSFFNNFVSLVAAKVFPLELAAHVFTYSAVLVQLLTLLIIVFTASNVLPTVLERFLAATSLVVLGAPETWLNVINMQFWFASGTFFLLSARSLGYSHLTYIAVSFMTGVSSLFFAPFFLLVYLLKKDKSFLFAFFVGCFAFLVQVFSVLSLSLVEGSSRFSSSYFANIPKGLESFYIPFFDFRWLTFLDWGPGVLALVLLSSFFFFLGRKGDGLCFVYVLAIVAYVALSVLASLKMMGGMRYALPVYFFIFCCFVFVVKSVFSGRSLWVVFPAAFLVLNVPDYLETRSVYGEGWVGWQSQIEALPEGETAQVLIFPQWPHAMWSMEVVK